MPVVAYCPFEQAISSADEQFPLAAAHLKRPVEELRLSKEYLNRCAVRPPPRLVQVKSIHTHSSFIKTAVAIHTCKQILSLVADYVGEDSVKPEKSKDAPSSQSFLQKLLADRGITAIRFTEIPSAERCTKSALKFPLATRIIITKRADVAHISHLQSFQSLRFIWMRDFAFSLSNIPRLAQLQGLVGIDVTITQDVESQFSSEERRKLHVEFGSYTFETATRLFERMPELAYLHIRDEAHVRWSHINRLSEACRRYIHAKHPSPPSALSKGIVFLQIVEHQDIQFSQLKEQTVPGSLASGHMSMQTAFHQQQTLRDRIAIELYSKTLADKAEKERKEQEELKREREERLARVQAAAKPVAAKPVAAKPVAAKPVAANRSRLLTAPTHK